MRLEVLSNGDVGFGSRGEGQRRPEEAGRGSGEGSELRQRELGAVYIAGILLKAQILIIQQKTS